MRLITVACDDGSLYLACEDAERGVVAELTVRPGHSVIIDDKGIQQYRIDARPTDDLPTYPPLRPPSRPSPTRSIRHDGSR